LCLSFSLTSWKASVWIRHGSMFSFNSV
jgi:hypothetical protein